MNHVASLFPLVGFGVAAAAQPAATFLPPPGSLEHRLIAAHNVARIQARVIPLSWDPALAAAAAGYAEEMARTGYWGHSPKTTRPGQGENLWMGTRGHFAPEVMVGNWVSERQFFRPGIFPNNSTTGRWDDVGHYTQIVWRGTTRVGCAVRSSRSHDYLVCRYSPKGNIDGRPVP